MRLISNCELGRKSEPELASLFGRVAKALVRTRRGSPARRNALGSLENIARERAVRQARRL